jgi:hypothetical protein
VKRRIDPFLALMLASFCFTALFVVPLIVLASA